MAARLRYTFPFVSWGCDPMSPGVSLDGGKLKRGTWVRSELAPTDQSGSTEYTAVMTVVFRYQNIPTFPGFLAQFSVAAERHSSSAQVFSGYQKVWSTTPRWGKLTAYCGWGFPNTDESYEIYYGLSSSGGINHFLLMEIYSISVVYYSV